MIETLESTAIDAPEYAKPCPFCGAEPYWLGIVIHAGRVEPHFYHPGAVTDKDCVLAGRGHSLDELAAWNSRFSHPSVTDVERAIRQTLGCATHLDAGLIDDTVTAAIAAMQSGEG